MFIERYIELCYLSPDWRVFSDEHLLACVVEQAADLFEIEPDCFCFFVDKATNHKHLLVKERCIPEDMHNDKEIDDVIRYMNGFAFGIGYT